jgi:ABC-type sulfate/molybdate transport systems ATPase subunit
VTHSPEEAIAIADVALALEDGRVVAAGPPREVLER